MNSTTKIRKHENVYKLLNALKVYAKLLIKNRSEVMKRFLLTFCVVMLAIPAFADNSEAVQYMNQSQGFSGFNRSLPQSSSFKNLEKNNKFTAPAVSEDEDYSDYDKDGYRIENDEPVKTEKKVIKSLKDSNGQVKTNPQSTPMTYDKFPQNYGNGDTMIMQNMMMPMGNMMF